MNIRHKILFLICVLCSLPVIQNCGGGSGGGGTSDALVADQLINDGWANIQVGQYATAITNFQAAIAQPMTDAQRVTAHSGLGWALSKNGKILESIPYFEIAADKGDKEAKAGLAGALVFRHQTTQDYLRAAELIGNMPPETFSSPHSGLGLSSAKIHALAAIAYALAGDLANAKVYINKAAALDSNMVGTTVDKIDDAFTLLGWRD